MSIKNIHKIEQPRERLQKYGPGKLSDAELLAIVLRTGPRGSGVLQLSKNILQKFPQNKLAQAAYQEIFTIRGVGPAKACEIVACFELGRRLLKDKQSVLLLSPQQVWEHMRDVRGHKKEHFAVFFLDTQNQIVEREIISVGTLNASLIHPREVFEPAIKHLAAHVLLAHNHPSGSLEPSDNDLNITRRLVDSGRLLGIEVIDHVIVTTAGFMSFNEKNLL